MGVRKAPRTKMVVPLRLWGTDSAGTPFNTLAYTLNVSATGVRIAGVKVPLAVGDAITVQYKQQRALYKVAWIGRPGDSTQEQIGVSLLESDKHIFSELSDPPNYKDEFSGKRSTRAPAHAPSAAASAAAAATPAAAPAAEPTPAPADRRAKRPPVVEFEIPPEIAAMANTDPAGPTVEIDENVDELVTRCTRALLRVEEMVRNKPPSAGVLHDFRDAISRLRQTVWALQQWHETRQESTRAFPLLAYLNAERLRFVLQATRDISDDIATKQVEIDANLLDDFFRAADKLRNSATTLPPAMEVGAPADALKALRDEIGRPTMPIGAAREYFARELQRIVRAGGVALARVEKGEMVCVGTSGNMPPTGTVLEVEEGAAADAVRSRALVYCEDTQSDPRMDAELCRAAGIGSVAFVPVSSAHGELLGIIEAAAAPARAFEATKLDALRAAAEVAAEVLRERDGAGV